MVWNSAVGYIESSSSTCTIFMVVPSNKFPGSGHRPRVHRSKHLLDRLRLSSFITFPAAPATLSISARVVVVASVIVASVVVARSHGMRMLEPITDHRSQAAQLEQRERDLQIRCEGAKPCMSRNRDMKIDRLVGCLVDGWME